MKKLIAILAIAIVLVGAVFAADNDKLTITSKVAPHAPGFRLYGGETSSAAADILAVASPADAVGTQGEEGYVPATGWIASTKDISLEDITVYCRLNQYSPNGDYSSTKSKFKGVATIRVTATALTATVGGTVYSTNGVANAVSESDVTIPNNGISAKAIVREQSNGGYANDTVKVTLTYDGKTVQDSAVYADFSFKWTKSDDLPPATYSANITMRYTVE